MEAISETASETAPLAILSLEKTRVLAIETLNSLTVSRCISHPQYDPDVDIPAAELAKVLTNTDRLLTDLKHHLLELLGDNPFGHGPLADRIGYQEGDGNLPDPQDLIGDVETIDNWLAKIRNKNPTVPDQPLLLPPSKYSQPTHSMQEEDQTGFNAQVLERHIRTVYDPSETLAPPVSEPTKPDLNLPTPSIPVPVKPSHLDRRECPQCQERCSNEYVLSRHKEVFHDPSRPIPDPQPSSPLYFLDA